MPADASLLDAVPLLQPLDPDEKELLAQQLDEIRFGPGQRVFRRGEPGDAIYVVSSGSIELATEDTRGNHIVFEKAMAGDFFGELSLLDGAPRSLDATALEETVVLRIDRNDLLVLFKAHPDAALDFLAVMGRRLREADRMLRYGPSRSANQEIEQRTTTVQRIADLLAQFSGSLTFLFVHLCWFLVWVSVNVGLVPGLQPFDPFPFGLLTMVVSLEAIFLSCFVLISQNRQAAKDRIRSEVEFETNIKAGLEVSQLHVKVDTVQEEILQRLDAIDKRRG